ncbi:hypothetical protein JCM8097_006251 [Rhodosporidiobolus ruineniae]
MPTTRSGTRDRSTSSPPPFASSSSATTSPSPTPLNKRTNTAQDSSVKPNKRARTTAVPLDEAQQVTSLPSSSRLPLANADVFYVPDFVNEDTARGWYEEMLALPDWYRPTLKVYGKEVTQSRQIAAYATSPSITIKYSGHPVNMQYDIPPPLRQIWDQVETKLGVQFNHVMANLYSDGQTYIGSHRDLKENRVIATVSLGAARTFNLKHDHPPSSPSSPSSSSSSTPDKLLYAHSLPLASGSLLVMQGDTQKHWKHEIPKEWGRKGKVEEGRISLTFRQVVK